MKVCARINLFYLCVTCSYKVLKHSGLTLVGLICYINKIDFLELRRDSTGVQERAIRRRDAAVPERVATVCGAVIRLICARLSLSFATEYQPEGVIFLSHTDAWK